MGNDQLKPGMRRLLKLFVYFYGLFGIQITYKEQDAKDMAVTTPMKKRSWKPFIVFIRCLVVAAYIVFVNGTTYSVTSHLRRKPSLLEFVRYMYHITSFIIILHSGLKMYWHAASLSRILFFPEKFLVRFYPAQFFIPLFMSMPSIVSDVQDAIHSLENDEHLIQKMASFCGLYVWTVQYAAICMYTECEAVILGQLQVITDMVMTFTPNEDLVSSLTRAKSSVRMSIEKINLIFGNVLLVFYIKIFMLVTLRFGAMILWGTSQRLAPWRTTINVLTSTLQIAQVFETTRLASLIIREALRAERMLYAPRKRNWLGADMARQCVLELRRVLRYRESIDALTISDCFVNCKAAIFTYLGTMFTCIAVILQFDFDVLKALEGAKQSAISLESKANRKSVAF